MANRFAQLFILPEENLYQTGSPILISRCALLKDSYTGNAVAQAKYQNISEKAIISLEVLVKSFDITGEELPDTSFRYLDFTAKRDSFFGQTDAIVLSDPEARSFKIIPKSVLFEDHSSWVATEDEWSPIITQVTLEKQLGFLSEQYHRDNGDGLVYVTESERDLWLCSCGAVNRDHEEKCHLCGRDRKDLVDSLNEELLRQEYEEHEAKARALEEEKAEKARIRKKKLIRSLVLSAIILLVVFGGTYFTTYILAGKAADREEGRDASSLLFLKPLTSLHDKQLVEYVDALVKKDDGHYDEATAGFRSLNGYRDSDELWKKSQYLWAEKEREDGNFDSAIALLDELKNISFGDAEEQYLETQYKKAKSLLKTDNEDNYDVAIELFEEVGKTGYYDTNDDINEARYLKADYNENKGSYQIAYNIFSQLGIYKDSKDRAYNAGYKQGKKLADQERYDSAITAFKSINSNEGIDYVKDKLRDKTEYYADHTRSDNDEPSVFYLIKFWHDEYKRTQSSKDYDYFLLALHNDCLEIANGYTLDKYDDYAVKPYFESHEQFYKALKSSSFSSKCSDPIYDEIKLIGNWKGAGYYFRMKNNENKYISYSLPYYDHRNSYYMLKNHIISLYDIDNDTKLCDLYRIRFISDTKADFYCYKNGRTYTLTKG